MTIFLNLHVPDIPLGACNSSSSESDSSLSESDDDDDDDEESSSKIGLNSLELHPSSGSRAISSIYSIF